MENLILNVLVKNKTKKERLIGLQISLAKSINADVEAWTAKLGTSKKQFVETALLHLMKSLENTPEYELVYIDTYKKITKNKNNLT